MYYACAAQIAVNAEPLDCALMFPPCLCSRINIVACCFVFRSLVQRPIDAVVSRYSEIYSMNATLEVLGGVMLLVNLLTPSRNFMLLFGFGQYLRIRFMLSEDAKRAWSGVRARTDAWVAHPMVPAIVRTGYAKLQAFMETMTDQEQMAAQAAQPGIMNKCTIM